MKDNNSLAIVIPAYKAKYLSNTLDSIAAQTDQRFCVYIGDDCSPENIEEVVERYKGRFNLVYKRFDANLGGSDLVAQWERCIAMTQDEEWIWLFSDDDCMDKGCVEAFYKQVEYGIDCDLMHFNLRIINGDMKTIGNCDFPPLISSSTLYLNKLKGKFHCYAVEYIFSRSIYTSENGFQKFDLAWGSDTATWIKFGKNGIRTIPNDKVSWRTSDNNITSNISDPKMILRKLRATNDYLMWAKSYWHTQNKNYDIITDLYFVRRLHGAAQIVTRKECVVASETYLKGNSVRKFVLLVVFYILNSIGKYLKK